MTLRARASTWTRLPCRGLQAKDLAGELKTRRKRSVASIIGRAQLTPEQADRLKAGSNAVRGGAGRGGVPAWMDPGTEDGLPVVP